MYSTDAASCVRDEISVKDIIKNNNAIRNIQVDDLVYLERDLDFHEKVFHLA